MVALLQVEVEALEEEIRVLQKLHARQWGIPTFPASASMTESTSVGKHRSQRSQRPCHC